MGRFGADVIHLRRPRAADLALEAQAPLLNIRRGVMVGGCADVEGLQRVEVDGGGVKEVRREADSRSQHG